MLKFSSLLTNILFEGCRKSIFIPDTLHIIAKTFSFKLTNIFIENNICEVAL